MEKKLSIEQIALIEETLVLNGLKFDDLKLELTDHIASEIEELMEENTTSFEENFKVVFEKWSDQLRPSSSFWVGVLYSTPKIVMNKWVSITKKTLLVSFVGSFILSFITSFFNNKSVFVIAMEGIKCLFILVYGLYLVSYLLVLRSKTITVFSHIYKRTWYLFFFYPFGYGLDSLPHHYNSEVFFSLFFPLGILITAFLYLMLAYKHIQFNKHLSLSNV